VSDAPLVIDAGTVLTPAERFTPGRVIVRRGLVESVGAPSDVRLPAGADRLNAPKLTLTPGFIEPHIHGSAGADVMDATFESLGKISRNIARHGTTSFLPTTVSAPPDALGDVLERLASIFCQTFDGAQPVGIHLEGPFICSEKRGAHRAEYIAPPDLSLFREWRRRSDGKLKLITMAPELNGLAGITEDARSSGVVVAMGHSNASYEEARAAIENGIHYAVHTFNAMRPLTHRDPGIAGAVLADDRVFAEIIADGVHVHPQVVRIFARAKGRDRVLLATDATSATDMPDGRYVLGNGVMSVVNGVCRDAEGRLAGSTLTPDAALRNFVRWTGMRLDDALFGLTVNPARALSLDGRGSIEPGARADLALIDQEFRVVKTFVEGRLVWTS